MGGWVEKETATPSFIPLRFPSVRGLIGQKLLLDYFYPIFHGNKGVLADAWRPIEKMKGKTSLCRFRGEINTNDPMQVAVIAWGQELPLEVGMQEPVLDIKAKIEQLLAIPVTAQTLAVSGWELFDGLDMQDYPIVTEGTKIELTIKPMFTPPAFDNHYNEIQVVVTFSSKQIVIQVGATETVGSLKEKIHIVEGTPIERMSLFFSGIELKDYSRYLTEYGIKEFSEIIVFLKAMGRIREDPPGSQLHIVVQTSSLLNAASIPVEIKDSACVNELRQLLLSTKILPQDDYLFIHKQRIMRDTRSLRWHGVEDGDSLYVFKGTVSRSGS